MRSQLVWHTIEMVINPATAFNIAILQVDQWGYRFNLHGCLGPVHAGHIAYRSRNHGYSADKQQGNGHHSGHEFMDNMHHSRII